ncbi:MAG TPA: ABC transporter permease [Capillimicrobium sp.]
MKILTDTATVFTRELRPFVHQPVAMLFGMIQPLVFLALFGPLLSATTGLPTDESLQWFVPGILVMLVLFASSMTGSGLQMEMQTGAHERLLVTPLSRSSLLIGRALKEIVPCALGAVAVIAAVLPFGFDLHVEGAVLGLGILALFAVGIGGLSYALAIASKGSDWVFWTVQQMALFPLLLLSGVLLPLEDGPGWLNAMADVNPLKYGVAAERALFDGDVLTADVAYGAIAALAVLVVGLWVGVRAMRAQAA